MGEKGIGQYIKIGERIKKNRIYHNFTQREFAKKVGIPVSTYSNYENGNRTPSLRTLQKIATELGEPLSKFMLVAPINEDEQQNEIEITNATNKFLTNYEREKKEKLSQMALYGHWEFCNEDIYEDFFTIFGGSGYYIQFECKKKQLYIIKDQKKIPVDASDIERLVRTSKTVISSLLDDMMNRK